LAALLPIEGAVPAVREALGISEDAEVKNLHQFFFTEQLVPDHLHGALLFTFLTTILSRSSKEREQLFIYEALREGIKFSAEPFAVVLKMIVPMMTELLHKSQNAQLLEAVESVMQLVYSTELSQSKMSITYLNEIGFHKLPESGIFEKETEVKREIIKLTCLVLDNLLVEIRDKKNYSLA
jgi:hypothetical protein